MTNHSSNMRCGLGRWLVAVLIVLSASLATSTPAAEPDAAKIDASLEEEGDTTYDSLAAALGFGEWGDRTRGDEPFPDTTAPSLPQCRCPAKYPYCSPKDRHCYFSAASKSKSGDCAFMGVGLCTQDDETNSNEPTTPLFRFAICAVALLLVVFFVATLVFVLETDKPVKTAQSKDLELSSKDASDDGLRRRPAAAPVTKEEVLPLIQSETKASPPLAADPPTDIEATKPAQPAVAPKVRVARWDNIRYMLSTMVAITHFLQGGACSMETCHSVGFGGQIPARTYLFLNESMVMTCFTLVSGMVASSAHTSLDKRRIKGSVSLYITCVLAQILYIGVGQIFPHFNSFFPRKLSTGNVLYSFNAHMWFIGAMLFWRLLAPFYMRLRGVLPVCFALFTSVARGYSSFDRNWLYMFFYVLGVWLKEQNLVTKIHTAASIWTVKIGAVVWMILNFIFLAFWMEARTFFSENGATMIAWINIWYPAPSLMSLKDTLPWERGTPDDAYLGYAWAYMVIMLFWQLVNALCVIVLVPSHDCWMTSYGSRTITSYIFHLFFVQALAETRIYPHATPTTGTEYTIDWSGAGWRQLAIFLIGLVVPLILMSPLAEKVLSPMVKPNWLLNLFFGRD